MPRTQVDAGEQIVSIIYQISPLSLGYVTIEKISNNLDMKFFRNTRNPLAGPVLPYIPSFILQCRFLN